MYSKWGLFIHRKYVKKGLNSEDLIMIIFHGNNQITREINKNFQAFHGLNEIVFYITLLPYL